LAESRAWERGVLVSLIVFIYLGVMIHGHLFGKMPIHSPFSLLLTFGLIVLCVSLALFYKATELFLISRKGRKAIASLTAALLLSLALGSVYYQYQRHSYSNQVKSLISQAQLSGKASNEQPNILLITVDTLRADHLSAYGYKKIRTANIDRLAEEGVLFENMIAQSSWTRSSFGSIWTSLYPSQHGANVRYIFDNTGEEVALFIDKLRDDVPRIAEFFSSAGYITVGINTNRTLNPAYGFDRGFQLYVNSLKSLNVARYTVLYSLLAKFYPALHTKYRLRDIDHNSIPASEVYEIFREAFVKLKRKNKPFFLWVHLFDPHLPYYYQNGTLGSGRYRHGVNGEDLVELRKSAPDLSEAREFASKLYDGEILFTDRYVGKILHDFSESGLMDKTLVVFTSDHGDELYDHASNNPTNDKNSGRYYRGWGHGHTMYEELIRVPLIMRFPNAKHAKRRVAPIAQHVDLLPTLLAFAGINVDRSQGEFEGTSLLKFLGSSGKLPERYAKSEFNMDGPEVKQIRSRNFKLIYKTYDRSVEFYDLTSDPGEKNNLVNPPKEPYRRMFRELTDWMARTGAVGPTATFEETIFSQRRELPGRVPTQKEKEKLKEDLKALGYIQ
jgi:arylsulfatase A-like enzyme